MTNEITILNVPKRRSSQNQLTKQKQANKKQQRQQAIAHKTFKEGEIVYFAATSFTILLKIFGF